MKDLSRRDALRLGAAMAAGVSWSCSAPPAGRRRDGLPPIRALTKGPKHHWFGYYDKLEFDPSGRFVLGMEVGFEHRTPLADDTLAIGCVDLEDHDRWTELGTTSAWGWQQGCMLQWRPGGSREVLWNDRDGDRFVCRVLDFESRALRTIPAPIYAIAPDGRRAVGLDFRRVQAMRPGYGYVGVPDPHTAVDAPDGSGIDLIDLETRVTRTIITIHDVVEESRVAAGNEHWFNHLLWNTDGTRFVFLHRWRPRGGGGFRTRMLTAASDGTDIRVLDDSGATSHFIWHDPSHVLAWSRVEGVPGFYLFDVDGGAPEPVGAGVMIHDGHCTYLRDRDWILCDTYPDATRRQHPYLFHVPSRRRIPLAHLVSPKEYRGEWRCDTHPRASPDGRRVVIDSPHGGEGRQLWLIEIGELLAW